MASTKTRIFQPGVLPTATVRQQGKTQIFHGLPVPVQPSERKLPQHSPEVFIADRESPMGTRTRLLPIEKLLEEAKPFLARPSTPAQAKSATSGWRSRLQWLRPSRLSRGRRLRLVVGLISLTISGYASLRDVSASTGRPQKVAALAAAPASLPAAAVAKEPLAKELVAMQPAQAEPPEVAQPRLLAERSAPTPAEPRKARKRAAAPTRSKGPSERRACDYLAAGDLTRAARTYEQLSQRTPADPVYAEAARILRIRLEGSAP